MEINEKKLNFRKTIFFYKFIRFFHRNSFFYEKNLINLIPKNELKFQLIESTKNDLNW